MQALKTTSVILLAVLLAFSFCNAHSKIKFKAKTLVQILDQYAKRGYTVIGPVEITDVTRDYLIPFHMQKIKKTKHIKIIDKKGKHVKLRKGDIVYIIKKGKKVIIIKASFKINKNE